MTQDIDALEKKLAELDEKIAGVEKRLPAHSVKPPIMTELFELEEEREALLKNCRIEAGYIKNIARKSQVARLILKHKF